MQYKKQVYFYVLVLIEILMINMFNFKMDWFELIVLIVLIELILFNNLLGKLFYKYSWVDCWRRKLSFRIWGLMIRLWNYIRNCMREWGIWYQYSMDQVMLINKKSKKQPKVEINSGHQLKDILIITLKIMIDNNK